MQPVKTVVCSGGRGLACIIQMLGMMNSIHYHADSMSFFQPFKTNATLTLFFIVKKFLCTTIGICLEVMEVLIFL